MSTAEEITYRRAAPGDVKLLTRMLWVAFNWRDEAVSEQHWPDPTAAAKYVDGFGRHGDAGVVPTTRPCASTSRSGFERVGGSGGSITLLRTLEPAGNRDA